MAGPKKDPLPNDPNDQFFQNRMRSEAAYCKAEGIELPDCLEYRNAFREQLEYENTPMAKMRDGCPAHSDYAKANEQRALAKLSEERKASTIDMDALRKEKDEFKQIFLDQGYSEADADNEAWDMALMGVAYDDEALAEKHIDAYIQECKASKE